MLFCKKTIIGCFLGCIMFVDTAIAQQCKQQTTDADFIKSSYSDPFFHSQREMSAKDLIKVYRSSKSLGLPQSTKKGAFPTYVGNYRAFLSKLRKQGVSVEKYELPRWLHNQCGVEYAAYRYELLSSKLGSDHPYMDYWLKNRSTLFKQCQQARYNTNDLPEHTGSFQSDEITQLYEHDRAYWNAALIYYRQDHEKALELFQEVSSDATSPHRFAAQISSIRILADKRRFDDANEKLKLLQQHQDRPEIIQYFERSMAGSLANLNRTQNRKREHLIALAKILQTPSQDIQSEKKDSLYHYAVEDIGWYIAHLDPLDWWLDDDFTPPNTTRLAVRDVAKNDELLDWLQAMTAGWYFSYRRPWTLRDHASLDNEEGKNVSDYALGRYDAGDGIHWLLPAVGRMLNSHPDRDKFLSIFSNINDRVNNCSATEVEQYFHGPLMVQAIRLLVSAGQSGEAYNILKIQQGHLTPAYWSAALGGMQWLTFSNQIDDARRFGELIKRQDLPLIYNTYSWELPIRQLASQSEKEFLTLFEHEGVNTNYPLNSNVVSLLTLLPANVLGEYSQNEVFTKAERAEFIRVAWTRAHALSSVKLRDQLTPFLLELNPSLEGEIESFLALPDGKKRERRIALFLLRTPAMRFLIAYPGQVSREAKKSGDLTYIDKYNHNDLNWWCPIDVARSQLLARKHFFEEPAGVDVPIRGWRKPQFRKNFPPGAVAEIKPSVLDSVIWGHPVAKRVDMSELTALSEAGNAPKFLSKTVLDWAKDFNNNRSKASSYEAEELAEALHRIVLATRYGCQRGQGHGPYSSKAHQALQRLFPESEWAIKTPYWFDYQHFRGIHKYRIEQQLKTTQPKT